MARPPTCKGWSPDNVMLQILHPFHWASRSSPTFNGLICWPWNAVVWKSFESTPLVRGFPVKPIPWFPCHAHCITTWSRALTLQHNSIQFCTHAWVGFSPPSQVPGGSVSDSSSSLRTAAQRLLLGQGKYPSLTPSFSPFSSSPGEDQLVARLLQMLMQVNSQPDMIGHIKASKKREGSKGRKTTKKQPCL